MAFPRLCSGCDSALRYLYGLPTIGDSNLGKNDYIVFSAGTTSDYIKLSYPTYKKIAQPRIAAFSVKTGLECREYG
jgi:prolyl-tRNA editing enzyme YbaK/EbsC (Cys-tRNA(Pro) deacylase)